MLLASRVTLALLILTWAMLVVFLLLVVLPTRDTLILGYIYQDCDWLAHEARVLGSDFDFRSCILLKGRS
jgi:hypothetical protein